MLARTRVDYDDTFVTRSTELSRQVAELRLVRDALVCKRNILSLKKLEMSLTREDQSAIKKELLDITVQWRKVSDQIDELIAKSMTHVTSCTIGYQG